MTQRGSRATASRRQERLGERWEGSAQEVFLGLREWRALHPTATLDEIETELDRRLAAMRAQILTDLALASRAAELQAEERPCCPTCGGRLQDEGKHTRRLMTLGNETVLLERDYAICPACVSRFFPLDRELGLLPNHQLTPRLEAAVTRLGQLVDFAEAAAVLRALVGVVVSEASVRRHTYAAGEAALAVEAQELAQVLSGEPEAAVKPERVQLSIDATKVPLVGGQWTDVKLGVFADLQPGVDEAGQPTLAAINLSYAARWEPAAQFGQTLSLEAHRRGLGQARLVLSPNDGADWIQGNLDLLAPDAVRILDEPHAAEHLATIAALVYGEGSTAAKAWTATQRQRLKAEPPAGVLAELADCQAQGPWPGSPLGANGERPADLLAREVAYFQKRAEQVQYAAFRAQGYPIGSGIVESGHKVVIGPRFKGAGQHWAPTHLNPLLVLRTSSCNGRWDETWPQVWRQRETTIAQRRRATQAQRRATRCGVTPSPAPEVASVAVPLPPPVAPRPPSPRGPSLTTASRRPAANHPWRRGCLRSAQRLAQTPNPKI